MKTSRTALLSAACAWVAHMAGAATSSHDPSGRLPLRRDLGRAVSADVSDDAAAARPSNADGHRNLEELVAAVLATGSDSDGQFGDGPTDSSSAALTEVIGVDDDDDIEQVEAGDYHSALLKKDGSVWMTGKNDGGQLGLGDTTSRENFTQVTALSDIVSVSAGKEHTYFLSGNGTVLAAGRNENGQLGDGTTVSKAVPVQVGAAVEGFEDIVDVFAGPNHGFFLKKDGKIFAAGSNYGGQLGVGDTIDKKDPTLITALNGTKIIQACGGDMVNQFVTFTHSAFLDSNGFVWTTGRDDVGQLGLDTSNSHVTPQKTSFSSIKEIACTMLGTIFLQNDGKVFVSGNSNSGELGIGSGTFVSSPVEMSFTDVVNHVKCGVTHCHLITQDGSLWATGSNSHGQLGVGDAPNQGVPVQVTNITGMRQVSGGLEHTLILFKGPVNYDNDFVNASMVVEDGVSKEAVFFFKIGRRRNATASVFESGCEIEANSTVVSVSHEVIHPHTLAHDLLKVEVDIDKSTIAASSLWTGTASVGNITMCLRTDLMHGAISVSYRKMEVVMIVDLSTNIFSLVGDVRKDEVDAEADIVAEGYNVTAYQCRGAGNFSDTGNDPLPQNTELELCLEPSSTDVKITEMEVKMYQGGELVATPVATPNVTDGLTQVVDFGTGAKKVITFMRSIYFQNADEDVIINGTVDLAFDDSRRRSLLAGGVAAEDGEEGGSRRLQEAGSSDFIFTVQLAPPEEAPADDVDAPYVDADARVSGAASSGAPLAISAAGAVAVAILSPFF